MRPSFDRSPLQGSLFLLAGAGLYTMLLFQAVSAQGGWQQPAFLERWLADRQTRLLVWDQLSHTLVVLLLSLPFAWILGRFSTRRLLPAAAMLVTPAVAWMVVDYFSLRDELPNPPPVITTVYFIDTAKVALILPLLALLLRRRKPS